MILITQSHLNTEDRFTQFNRLGFDIIFNLVYLSVGHAAKANWFPVIPQAIFNRNSIMAQKDSISELWRSRTITIVILHVLN